MRKAVIAENAQTDLMGSCLLGQSFLNWYHTPSLHHTTTIPKTRSQKWSMDYLAVRAENNGVNTIKHIHQDHVSSILRGPLRHGVGDWGGCRADPFGLERSKHLFCWWGPPGEKPLMLSSCSATSPSHPQQRAAVSYLLPDTKCAKMIFMNLPSLHTPLLPYSFSLFSTIPLSMFSFLSPPLPYTRFQFEATAGNTAISGGRPGVAAPVSEAAQECATVTSS